MVGARLYGAMAAASAQVAAAAPRCAWPARPARPARERCPLACAGVASGGEGGQWEAALQLPAVDGCLEAPKSHIALYPPGASHSDFMPSPTWAPRFLSHFRGALFSSQRATARIGLLRPSLAHGVEPVARSGPFHGDPAPMAPRVSRCVGGSREFLGGSREWSTPSWCILMHHARAKPQSAGSF